MSYFDELLKARHLEKPELPLWKLQITDEEYEHLKQILPNAVKNHIDCRREAALYYAEWWKREFRGGTPSKEQIGESLHLSKAESEMLYEYAQSAIRQLKINVIKFTNHHYFRTLLLQGGLPIRHIRTNYGSYKNFLSSLIRELMYKDIDSLDSEIVKGSSAIHYLPASCRSESIYDVSFQIAQAIINDREDLLPYQATDEDFQELTRSLKDKRDEYRRTDRTRKPFSVKWFLHKNQEKITLGFRINFPSQISSATNPNINQDDCTQFDLYVMDKYMATYKQIIKVQDGDHHDVRIFKRIKSKEIEYLWEGGVFLDAVIRYRGQSVSMPILGCNPPDFDYPQLFENTNDNTYVLSQKPSENSIVIFSDKWTTDAESQPVELQDKNGNKKLSLVNVDNDIMLRNEENGDQKQFRSIDIPYEVEFGNVYLPWIERSNFKLVKGRPNVTVFDENNCIIRSDLYYKLYGQQNWTRATRAELPFGLLELKIVIPATGQYLIEKFYCIKDMNFTAIEKAETTTTIQYRLPQVAEVTILPCSQDDLSIRSVGNMIFYERTGNINHIPPTFQYEIWAEGMPHLKLWIPSTFKCFCMIDSEGNIKSSELPISINELYNYQIITNGCEAHNLTISTSTRTPSIRICESLPSDSTSMGLYIEKIKRMARLDRERKVVVGIGDYDYTIQRYAYAIDFTNDDEDSITIYHNNKVTNINELCAVLICDQEDTPFDILSLSQSEDGTFSLPSGAPAGQYLLFDTYTKVEPKLLLLKDAEGGWCRARRQWRRDEWSRALDNEQFPSSRWSRIAKMFKIAADYAIPFKMFNGLAAIASSPQLLAKFAIQLFFEDMTGAFSSSMDRFEQELNVSFHSIRFQCWNETIQQLPQMLANYSQQIRQFIIKYIYSPSLTPECRDLFARRLLEGANIVYNPRRFTPQEVTAIRAEIHGMNMGGEDLPVLDIQLNHIRGYNFNLTGWTEAQKTMIKSSLKVYEYLSSEIDNLWDDDSIKACILFYYQYFNPAYCQILIKQLS